MAVFSNLLSKLSLTTVGQGAAILLAAMLPISTAATSVLVIVILLTWLGPKEWGIKKALLTCHPLVIAIYPLVGLVLLGAFYSVGEKTAMWNSLLDSVRLLLIPVLLYFYQNEKVAKAALWAFVGAMILTLLLAYLKVYAGLPIGLKYTTGAIFKSHIKTSFFMSIAAFLLALHLPRSRFRVGIVLLIGLMIYYLLCMSIGRIGYVTLVICFVALAWFYYRWKGIIGSIILATLLLGTAYLTSDVFSKRVNLLSQDLDLYYQGGRLLDSSLGSRLQFAKTSLQLIMQHPWLGWGTGSFGEAYQQFHAQEKTLLTDNPHNEYLRMGVEGGLAGIILLLFLFYRQWQLAQQLTLPWQQVMQAVLLAFMAGCFFNSWIKDSTEAYFYCVITAICFSQLPLSKKEVIKPRAAGLFQRCLH